MHFYVILSGGDLREIKRVSDVKIFLQYFKFHENPLKEIIHAGFDSSLRKHRRKFNQNKILKSSHSLLLLHNDFWVCQKSWGNQNNDGVLRKVTRALKGIWVRFDDTIADKKNEHMS